MQDLLSQEHEVYQKMKSDRKMFFKLYDMYFDIVYRYAIRRVGHSENLKRMVNRTFYRAYYQLESFFEENVSFRAFLLRYAKIVADEMGAPMRADVDDILADLEQRDFEMVIFKIFEGLPDGEVSYILGVPESSFTPFYYRTLTKLKGKTAHNAR